MHKRYIELKKRFDQTIWFVNENGEIKSMKYENFINMFKDSEYITQDINNIENQNQGDSDSFKKDGESYYRNLEALEVQVLDKHRTPLCFFSEEEMNDTLEKLSKIRR